MIQIWKTDDVSTKWAYFVRNANITKFVTINREISDIDEIRKLLRASGDMRKDIKPRPDAEILYHTDDHDTITEFFQKMIDDIEAESISTVIGADLYRYIVYILKFLELMSVQLGLQKLSDSVILGHEAGSALIDQQKLAVVWSEKSAKWLHVVGKSESASHKAKDAIYLCNNVDDMRAIVEAFPAIISEALK